MKYCVLVCMYVVCYSINIIKCLKKLMYSLYGIQKKKYICVFYRTKLTLNFALV